MMLAAASTASASRQGVEMWDRLKQTDIEQAKNQLATRRAEILARQADELRVLEADRAELETLYRMAEAFAQKFKKATMPAPAPIVAPAANNKHGHKHTGGFRRPDQRNYSRTNFEAFSRAVAKAL